MKDNTLTLRIQIHQYKLNDEKDITFAVDSFGFC